MFSSLSDSLILQKQKRRPVSHNWEGLLWCQAQLHWIFWDTKNHLKSLFAHRLLIMEWLFCSISYPQGWFRKFVAPGYKEMRKKTMGFWFLKPVKFFRDVYDIYQVSFFLFYKTVVAASNLRFSTYHKMPNIILVCVWFCNPIHHRHLFIQLQSAESSGQPWGFFNNCINSWK